MIGKVLRGTDARRLLYYLYGPGKANEHTDPHLVAGFADPAELEPERRPSGAPDLRRLAGLLAQPLAALAAPGYDKPVWHCSVRAAPEDRVLSDTEWAQIASAIMHRTGLAPQGDDLGVRWVAVRHATDHIHLVATLGRQDGTRPRIWNDYYRIREACQDSERRFGLRRTAPADRTAARRATRAETEQAARRGWGEPPRVTLRREVCASAAGARTEQEFFARLQRAGVLVRQRHSTIHPDEVTGYAVGLPNHTTRHGGVIWYGGSKLAADLTLPKLRRRWNPPSTTTERSGTRQFTATERNAIYRHASRQAVAAAEHVRRCSATDPGAAADAAWAAADTLHIAARVLRNPALRCAADTYGRAARAPYGRTPRRTRNGEQLRTAARLMALIDDVTGDPTLAFVVLIANLVALAAAVADLRQAQQHAAQAAAARQAAQHLRAGLAQARSQVLRPAPPERRERARRANSANAARGDFPMPLWPEHPISGRPADVGASPQGRMLPRRRAGRRP